MTWARHLGILDIDLFFLNIFVYKSFTDGRNGDGLSGWGLGVEEGL